MPNENLMEPFRIGPTLGNLLIKCIESGMKLFRSQVPNYFLWLFVIDKKICKNIRIVLMFHYAVVSWLIWSNKIIEQIIFFEKNSLVRTVLKPYFIRITKKEFYFVRFDKGRASLWYRGADIFIIQSFSDKSITSNENLDDTIQTNDLLRFSNKWVVQYWWKLSSKIRIKIENWYPKWIRHIFSFSVVQIKIQGYQIQRDCDFYICSDFDV